MDAVDLAFAGAVRHDHHRVRGWCRSGEPLLLSLAARLERTLRWPNRRPATGS
jgi:hypothetical protein